MTIERAMLIGAVGAVLAGGGLGVAARGAEPPPEVATPAARPATDGDALRGPTLSKQTEDSERTIVQRDFQGRLKKLEENPALAALAKVPLTQEDRTRADRVIGERAAAIDTIVRDNLRLVIEFVTAKQAGESAETSALQSRVLEKAMPFIRRGPLVNELRAALPAEKYAALRGMVDEYNRALTADRAADPMMAGKQKDENKLGSMIAAGAEGFVAEARASFQRIVDGGGQEFEALIRMLALTPQQEGRVRQIATEQFSKTYGKPTKAQQIKVFLDIYAELDVEQRHRLAEHIGEENRMKRGVGTK